VKSVINIFKNYTPSVLLAKLSIMEAGYQF